MTGWRGRPAWTAAARLVGLITLAGCGAEADPVPELRIGLLAHTEGAYADFSGGPTVEGARLARDAVHGRGGVDIDGIPHRVRLVVEEHGHRIEDVTLAARRLINREGVHALIGPQLSQHAISVGRLAEFAGVPMISPMSSSPETTRGRSWVFRVAFLDEAQASALARLARDLLGVERAGIITDITSPYSRGLAESFGALFRNLGGSVIEEKLAPSSTDDASEGFGRALARLAAADVQVVLLPMRMTHVLRALEQADSLGLDLTFLGTDGWDIATALRHPAADGAFVTHQWSQEFDFPLARDFVASYAAVHGGPPRTTAALTYDAVGLIVAAATRAGTLEAASLRDALLALPPYEGVSGTVHFAGSGDPRRSVVVSRLVNGKLTLHGVVDP